MLKKKILMVFLISLIVLLFIAFGMTMLVIENVQRSFEIEKQNYGRMVEQISNLYSQRMNSVAESYSLWSELYAYTKNPDRGFEEAYLDIDYFEKYGIDFVAVYNLDNFVYADGNDERILRYLKGLDVKDLKNRFHEYDLPKSFNFPIEYFVYSICKSSDVRREDPVGFFVVGNTYDLSDFFELRKLANSDVKFSETLPSADSKILNFAKPLKNSSNVTIGYLNFTAAFSNYNYLIGNIIVTVVLFSAVFVIFMSYIAAYLSANLIRPFNKIVYSIENGTVDNIEQYTQRPDEIGELSRTVKAYLNQREEINVYLKELESKNASLRRLNEEVRMLLEKDQLTGLLTRFVFNSQIERLYVSSLADSMPLSLIMLDIDDFKKINDTHGHLKGDDVLRRVGSVILKNTRMSDFPIRMGGEEILILLPQTELNGAFAIAERIRRKVEEEFHGDVVNVTISLGVTQLNGNDTIESLLKRVDDAVYMSKKNGKNQTTII